MPEPLVDVVIATHNPERPIHRSVGSILRHTASPVRVSVVCHNTDPAGITARLAEFSPDPRLRILELRDGVPSPSEPFNFGLDAATARFTSIMGSDDELEPGAMDSWLQIAERDNADVVITRLMLASGRVVATPPVRGQRESRLDPVRDRLSYRSAPLGLVSRERFASLRLTPGLRAGGDLGYVTQLWFSGARISFDRTGPAYVVHNDATDRVTLIPKSVAEDFAWLTPLVSSPWALSRSPAERTSIAVKLVRRQLFGAVDNRVEPATRLASDEADYAHAARELLEFAPQLWRVLSLAEYDLFRGMLTQEVGVDRLMELAAARKRFPRPRTALPRDILKIAAREAPFPLALAHRRVMRSTQRIR